MSEHGVVEADSNSKGTPVKAALVKVLAGVITVAIIGSGLFVGRRLNKQPQGDKKVTTISKKDTTQKQKDVKKVEKKNNKKKDTRNEKHKSFCNGCYRYK